MSLVPVCEPLADAEHLDRFGGHSRMSVRALAGAALLSVASAQDGARDDGLERDYGPELPRLAPLEPAEALGSFRLRPGFRIEQVAAEPLVRDPIAMAFDEDGRLFVVEMRGYSEWREERLGSVRLLEDTDGDGHFDTSHLFAEGLAWPTAIACWNGGVFVAAAPDVFYLADTDGDGRADRREHVFTGFGLGNVQGLVNSFRWGLDGRIHGAGSLCGGEIVSVAEPSAPAVPIRGRDFAFDPRTRVLQATSGGAQHGLSFDAFGRKLLSANSDHVQLVMFEDRYAARNPYLPAPRASLSIAADGGQADVFRVSPVEPWRIVRTRLRVKGIVSGPVEGGGTPAGYFTGATGVTVYRGDAFPSEYEGNAFIGDVGSNLVHRKTLEPDGVALIARRAEPKGEFLASTDNWFRPVQFANGPDGALYVADMYREMIEHPASLPPVVKRHLDLRSGRDRGRIYRVVPDDFRQPRIPRLSAAPSAELAALTGHANGWHRDSAARLLVERADLSIVGDLERVATTGELPAGRVCALNLLAVLGALDAAVVMTALEDEDPRVREHGVRLSEDLLARPEIRERLLSMTQDPDARVRYQLAFTLGEVEDPARIAALVALVRRDGTDPWARFAIRSALTVGAGSVLTALAEDAEFAGSRAGRSWLADLALQAGASGLEHDVAAVLALIEELSETETQLAGALASSLVRGLQRSRQSSGSRALLEHSKVAERLLAQRWTDARQRALDEGAQAAVRTDAIEALALAPFEDVRETLARLLDPRHPVPIQLAALATLASFRSPAVATLVLDAWRALGPEARGEAVELLLSRPAWTDSLLDALESRTVRANQLDSTRVHLLRTHPRPDVRTRAGRLFASAAPERLQATLASLRPVLRLTGDPAQGAELFRDRCSRCHRRGGVGDDAGPDLTAVAARGAESILLAVVDPNREIHPQYVDYMVLTTDGQMHTGILAAESSSSLTLRRAGGVSETILRAHVDLVRSSDISLMPEGLIDDLEPTAVADLLAFLLGEE